MRKVLMACVLLAGCQTPEQKEFNIAYGNWLDCVLAPDSETRHCPKVPKRPWEPETAWDGSGPTYRTPTGYAVQRSGIFYTGDAAVFNDMVNPRGPTFTVTPIYR
jgi:hypothetical protein